MGGCGALWRVVLAWAPCFGWCVERDWRVEVSVVMAKMPSSVAEFLAGKRFAVGGGLPQSEAAG